MIDFSLTEEQRVCRKLVRDFAQKEIVPIAPDLDQEQRHSPEIVKKFFEIGLLHYAVPEEYGGAGLGSLEGCLFSEELGAACAGIAACLGGNILGLTPLLIAGSPELKEELLTKHASGPNLGAFCLTEADAGSDVASMRSTARREGDEYVINGTKHFITNGGVASLYSVFAKEDPEPGYKGISAFMVPADTPGVKHGKKEDKMGQRTTDTSEVIFEDVHIPARFRLGQGRDGFKIALMTLDGSRAGVGAAAVGIARAAMEAAVDNLVEPGDRVIVGVNGVFGTRLVDICGQRVQERREERPHVVRAEVCDRLEPRRTIDGRRVCPRHGGVAHDLPDRGVALNHIDFLLDGVLHVIRIARAGHGHAVRAALV